MVLVTKICWLTLALIHLPPALVLFNPDLLERLYDVPSDGELGLLLVHRGALFLAVSVIAALAAFRPEARQMASLLIAISLMSFLILYFKSGAPDNSLRKIALVDLVALIPLLWVVWESWIRP